MKDQITVDKDVLFKLYEIKARVVASIVMTELEIEREKNDVEYATDLAAALIMLKSILGED